MVERVLFSPGGATEAKQDAEIALLTAAEFWRIKNKRFRDTEEIRYDIPASLISADIYTGVAPDGTATSDASWTVIRTRFDSSGNPNREQIRLGLVWDNRSSAGSWV